MVTIGLSRTVSEINGDVRQKSNENRQFSNPPLYLTPPVKGFPVEFVIGVRGPKCLNDGPTRWSKKFSDRFSRFDTIPAVTDTQPPSHSASQASSLKSNISCTVSQSNYELDWLLLVKFMCEYCIFTMDWTSRISYVRSHWTILLLLLNHTALRTATWCTQTCSWRHLEMQKWSVNFFTKLRCLRHY